MHRAPAVRFPVSRSRWHLGFVAMLSLAVWLAALAFAWGQSATDGRSATILGAALVAPLWAFRGWQTAPTGQLRWDGQHWHWSGFQADGQCQLALLADMQRVVLVRLTAASHLPVWLWLEARADNAFWLPLRRAIVSSLQGAGNTAKRALADPGELA